MNIVNVAKHRKFFPLLLAVGVALLLPGLRASPASAERLQPAATPTATATPQATATPETSPAGHVGSGGEVASACLMCHSYEGLKGVAENGDSVSLYVESNQAAASVHGQADLGCASCHGEMGMGGRPNPGSLKGYIPGFLGGDFRELVRNDEELMTWLRDGALPRISEHPIGRIFFRRQRIHMPAFKQFVAADKLDAVAAYVRWLADGKWDTPLSLASAGTIPPSQSRP